jgi:hypothetical protein
MKVWASVACIGYGHPTEAIFFGCGALPLSRCEDCVPGHRRHRREGRLKVGNRGRRKEPVGRSGSASMAGTDLFSDLRTR